VYSLKTAAQLLSPDGRLTEKSLRTMARQGKLRLHRVAGKDCCRAEDIEAMLAAKKRQPPCLVHWKLWPFLARWRKQDIAANIHHVVDYNGRPIKKDPYHAWESVRVAAGATTVDRPHVLRHTCVTLFVKAGLTLPEIASFTGMTTTVLERYYLHGSLEDQTNIVATAPKIAPRNGAKRAATK
jgi:integrase